MSTTAKVTIGLSVIFTASIVTYVHLSQILDRKKMKAGILNDMNKEQKKIQNLKMLQTQAELKRAYEREAKNAES
ncbi:protein PET117 homolog, mitochondrial-like [Octopus bimaculoides]|uniref:Uncharacterized protein n=1 Tax=Octopus bimaculoides TaxID=37653 RepID=A0A0L8GWP6_OCTBM|nr:protein PET117 homolog, mitochondrial-like [Octopus bimaculoides]